MKIEALERLLVQTLRTELSSLKANIGQTKEFIYIDYPRLDAKMPRISLSLTGSIQRPAAIGANVDLTGGTLAVYEEATFEIGIFVHRTNATTNLSPKRKGTSLRDYLGDQVVDVLLKQRKVLFSQGILDIEKIGETSFPFDEETELFVKTITFRVLFQREF